jgi:hypothetical protein
MKLSDLSPSYLLAMVTAMYAYEVRMVNESRLLWDTEMSDFYNTYMGGPI